MPVSLERLREETAAYGQAAFLLTVSDDGRPHAVSVAVVWDGEDLVAATGRRTARNAAARPQISLLWSPIEAGGYSLIVDGTASVEAGDDGGRVAVRPSNAVLHRSAAGPDGEGACGSDCVPVFKP